MITPLQVDKRPLDFSRYEIYGIDQRYKAYECVFENVSQNQSDDLEYEYYQKGYKIFHADLQRTHSGLYRLVLIIAKMEMTF